MPLEGWWFAVDDQVVEIAVMSFFNAKISHPTDLLSQKAGEHQTGQSGFFASFTQSGLLGIFVRLNRSGRHLDARLRHIGMPEDQQVVPTCDLGEGFVPDQHGIRISSEIMIGAYSLNIIEMAPCRPALLSQRSYLFS